MANADAPRGFRPAKNLDGTPFNGGTVKCSLVTGDSTATFVGDLVKLSGTASAEGYPSVAQGAASDTAFFGVISSFDVDRDDLASMYRPASTARLCNVVPAGNALFVVQSSGATAITDVGETADVTVGSGDTSTGYSAMELNHADIGTGLNLLILGFDERPDNEIASANVDVIVKINETAFHGGDIGV